MKLRSVLPVSIKVSAFCLLLISVVVITRKCNVLKGTLASMKSSWNSDFLEGTLARKWYSSCVGADLGIATDTFVDRQSFSQCLIFLHLWHAASFARHLLRGWREFPQNQQDWVFCFPLEFTAAKLLSFRVWYVDFLFSGHKAKVTCAMRFICFENILARAYFC